MNAGERLTPVRPRAMGFQGAHYVMTGAGPLVHLSSFEVVTGPKVDHWLVHTVGLLATAIGILAGIVRHRAGGPRGQDSAPSQ